MTELKYKFTYDTLFKLLFQKYPEFREVERLRAEARSNEASALLNAETTKALAIAKNMIVEAEPIEKIIRYTGLTRAEVEGLRDAN